MNVSNSTWVSNIYGTTTVSSTTVPVIVSIDGQLGTASSSRRFKKEIQPMDKASEAILVLKPVTFHYKSDKKSTPQFGLIAEEVAEVNPDLVVRDEKGEIVLGPKGKHKGRPQADSTLRDTENVALSEDVEAYFKEHKITKFSPAVVRRASARCPAWPAASAAGRRACRGLPGAE